MKKYAIVDIKGSQFKVIEGEDFLLDKLSGGKIEAKVLLFSDGGKISIGQPYLSKIKTSFKVLEDVVKGGKIHVRKYKAKSRYRKKIGFRPRYTKILTEKIG